VWFDFVNDILFGFGTIAGYNKISEWFNLLRIECNPEQISYDIHMKEWIASTIQNDYEMHT
jgi:hypothetical protein